MLRICQICGKGVNVGHNVSYSKRRTKHIFLPNLRWADLKLNGKVKKVKICMKCLKRAKMEGRVFNKVVKVEQVAKVPARIAPATTSSARIDTRSVSGRQMLAGAGGENVAQAPQEEVKKVEKAETTAVREAQSKLKIRKTEKLAYQKTKKLKNPSTSSG